jgi:hypothetical protein
MVLPPAERGRLRAGRCHGQPRARPLLDYRDGQGLLFSVAAAGTIDEVSARILHAPAEVTRRASRKDMQLMTHGRLTGTHGR